MSDKDQFTFDDDDDFPETDLSAAFSDGEQEAEDPVSVLQEEPEPVAVPGFDSPLEEPASAAEPKKAKKAKKEKKVNAGDGSKSRILLLVLLLIVGGAAGAYYFMDLGGTTPSVPTAAVPAKKAVPLPAKPAKAPVVAKSEPAKPVKVAVPPPPPKKAAEKPAAKPTVTAKPSVKETVAVPTPKPAPVPAAKQTEAKPPKQETVESKAIKAAPAPKKQVEKPIARQETKPVTVPTQVVGGAYGLDAGSYLFESNRNALIEKIKKLGYDPLVTPVDANLDMTRLRLGTFSKDEVKEALGFARTIESGSYSSPAGDQYVIYAGTFLSKGNIDKLTKRFNDAGMKVYPEPVQVVRTLSRIRFGSFATKEDASAAAAAAGDDGVKAVVVKSK